VVPVTAACEDWARPEIPTLGLTQSGSNPEGEQL
jgi:hypothetical protein